LPSKRIGHGATTHASKPNCNGCTTHTLTSFVRHNTQTGRLMDVQRDLRNAEARLAQVSQTEATTQPPVVCISVYKYSHLFSDN
jgi:hypothetical protein